MVELIVTAVIILEIWLFSHRFLQHAVASGRRLDLQEQEQLDVADVRDSERDFAFERDLVFLEELESAVWAEGEGSEEWEVDQHASGGFVRNQLETALLVQEGIVVAFGQ